MDKKRGLASEMVVDFCWMAFELCFIMGLALLIVYAAGLLSATAGVQSAVVVPVAIVGVTTIELARRKSSLAGLPELLHKVGTVCRPLPLGWRVGRQTLFPKLGEIYPDIENLLLGEEQENKEVNVKLKKRLGVVLDENARGRQIAFIAVLPAEKERLVFYELFWYRFAEERGLNIEWIEPKAIDCGIDPSLNATNQDQYIPLFGIMDLGEQIGQKAAEWLKHKAGGQVGQPLYLTCPPRRIRGGGLATALKGRGR